MGVEKVVGALVPPSDEKGVQRWRWAVAVTLSAVVLWVMWAMGLFTALGFPGMARAGELDKLDVRLAAMETKQTLGLRIALADEICRVYFQREENRGNQALWATLNSTFNDRQEDYASLNNGQPYDIRLCSAPR